ncbi:MAG: outer membrane beta-barrel domain-containing protein [Pseudomonadales bacterium]|nr:outer membrane beta-barrel domain-containing protein [Pseudomonadales bacterium]
MKYSPLPATLFCLVGLLLAPLLKAEDAIQVQAVQEKIFHKHHELSIVAGYIPDDDFFALYPAGVNYIYHFNDVWAWEVIRAQTVSAKNRDIQDNLKFNFDIDISEFDQLTGLIESALLLKPSYGKDAIFNRWVVNHETYISIGGGLAQYRRNFSFGESEDKTAAMMSLGIGRKYFLTENIALSFELRDLIIFKEDKTENNLYLGLGFSFRFNLAPRTAVQSRETEQFYQYLRDNHE